MSNSAANLSDYGMPDASVPDLAMVRVGGAGLLAPLPVPEPGLTPAEMVARARDMKAVLRAEAAAADARGAYSAEMHERFRKAGFYRIMQPRLFGGYEFDPVTFYRVMLEVSAAHPATGWCLTLGASHSYLIGCHWPLQAQVELFGRKGDFIAPHRPMPSGRAVPVEGGFRVTGLWRYCSGIPHATHLVGGAWLERSDGPPTVVQLVLPRDTVTVLDDWGGDQTIGMKASGSNSVSAEDVFVPAHHVVEIPALAARPDGMEAGTEGTRLHGNPMYLGRLMAPYHASLVVPVIGAARAALEEYETIVRNQAIFTDPTVLRADHGDFQRHLGQALAWTDAAEAVLIRGLEQYMDLCRRWAADRTPITVEENLRLWLLLQQGGRMACDAVERLFQTAGSTATRQGAPLLGYFHDAQMYRSHMSSQYETFSGYLGRAHLGRPTGFQNL